MLQYLTSNLWVDNTPVRPAPTPAQLETLKNRIKTYVTNNGLRVETAPIIKYIMNQFPGAFTYGELEAILQSIQDEYDALRAAAEAPAGGGTP